MNTPTRLLLAIACAFALAGPARAETRTYVVDPGASKVTFATSAIERIEGASTAAHGQIAFDPAAPAAGGTATIVIPTATLKSDNARRDEHMHANALESDTYPEIRVDAMTLATDAAKLDNGVPAQFQVTAKLTLHGTTHEIAFPATATVSGDTLTVDGGTDLLMSDYGITPPRLLFIVVRDRTEIGFHIVAHAVDMPAS